jgi:phage FluMu gp28-like protein
VGEREALEVLDKAEKHSTALVRLGSKWAKSRTRGSELAFDSGGRIIAVPSSSGGRSFSGNVFLDEFAYVERPAEIWDAAAGSTLHGFRMRVASTPNGVGNEFHDLWTNPKANKGWNKHFFPLDRAIAEGMRVDIQDCWKLAKGDPRIFDQLFNCKFLDGEQQYLPTEIVDACAVDDTYCYEGENFGGLDVGKTADLSVLYVVRRDPVGMRWVVDVVRRKRTNKADLDAMVAYAMGEGRCSKLAIDATGIGSFPAEEYQRVFGAHRIEAFTFTNQSKEALATGLYQILNDRAVRYARSDALLRNDLLAIRRIITAAGNIRYDAPRTDAGHADNAWALALALHASGGIQNFRTEVPR